MKEPEIMEQLLLKTAERLDGLPEQCLDVLWHRYARQTIDFEPTQEWEKAVLVFCLINAKRMKNHLLNYYWKTRGGQVKREEDIGARRSNPFQPTGPGEQRDTPCPLLQFPFPRQGDER